VIFIAKSWTPAYARVTTYHLSEQHCVQSAGILGLDESNNSSRRLCSATEWVIAIVAAVSCVSTTRQQLPTICGASNPDRSFIYNLKALQEKGIITRNGPDKGGYWEIIERD